MFLKEHGMLFDSRDWDVIVGGWEQLFSGCICVCEFTTLSVVHEGLLHTTVCRWYGAWDAGRDAAKMPSFEVWDVLKG